MNDGNAVKDSPPAVIVYFPEAAGLREKILFSQKAKKVILFAVKVQDEETAVFPLLESLCRQWKDLLERKIREEAGSGGESVFLEVFQSCRRRYAVSGLKLTGGVDLSKPRAKHYLFTLERLNPGRLNFAKIFREWKLSPREQDLARLIFSDRTNKEIAHELNLSLNTVKAYMKLLKRKLSVSTRAGILATLCVPPKEGKNPILKRPE